MHEILRGLAAEAVDLDLGCNRGSFARERTAARVVRLDYELRAVNGQELGVRADAGKLPFRGQSMQCVIANHSLEHIDDLSGCLAEIGRVLARNGSLFVSVPDASTLTDRIYRWLARGGGHVNAFVDPEVVARQIEASSGMRLVGTKTLYSSLSFLHPANAPRPRPRRLLLLGGGFAWTLHLYMWLSRRLDRVAGTRTSIYGWAFYFGSAEGPLDLAEHRNVCIRCGSATDAAALTVRRRWFFFRSYSCPCCGACNVYSGG